MSNPHLQPTGSNPNPNPNPAAPAVAAEGEGEGPREVEMFTLDLDRRTFERLFQFGQFEAMEAFFDLHRQVRHGLSHTGDERNLEDPVLRRLERSYRAGRNHPDTIDHSAWDRYHEHAGEFHVRRLGQVSLGGTLGLCTVHYHPYHRLRANNRHPIIADDEEPQQFGQVPESPDFLRPVHPYEPSSPRFSPLPEAMEIGPQELAQEEALADAANRAEEEALQDVEILEDDYPRSEQGDGEESVQELDRETYLQATRDTAIAQTQVAIENAARQNLINSGYSEHEANQWLEDHREETLRTIARMFGDEL